jgi:hypothetical protein
VMGGDVLFCAQAAASAESRDAGDQPQCVSRRCSAAQCPARPRACGARAFEL